METGRDRILKAISHVQPEVTPINVGGIYDQAKWFKHFEVENERALRAKLDLDIEYARAVYAGPVARPGAGIFGTPVEGVYGADGAGYAESRGGCPLAKATSVADIENYRWPDPSDFDYDVIRLLLEKIPAEKARRVDVKYGILKRGKSLEDSAGSGPWIPLICTMFDLFGFENTLTKFCLEPKLVEAAVAKIDQFLVEFTRRSLEASKGMVEAFYFGDDFSTQRGMMISPEHWRRFLKPTYRRIFDLARSYGVKVWFHSCGSFRPVLPDLIECGMDVWETVQVHLQGNDPTSLKRDFGKDITFYGAISTQSTLPRGTVEDVRAEVRERIRVLGKGGGYICGSDHGIMPDVPIENVLAMVDEARKFRT